jgi:nucleotide-binding universal stress UspA family protein
MNSNLIIYPTDFSLCAENALKYAIHLAKATKSEIKILHEIDLTGSQSASMISADSLQIVTMMETEAKEQCEQLKDQIAKEGLKADYEILIGSKLFTHIKSFENAGQTMVVMGTSGSGKIENRIFGSKTHKIIREVDFPVFVVPEDAKFDGIAEILFATDYNSVDMIQFNRLLGIGSYFHSNVTVAHVAEGDFKKEIEEIFLNDFENKVRGEVAYQQLQFKLLYSKNIEDRLHAMIEEENVDLLVLVTQKRSFFERFFDTSLTKKMVYHTHIPMLVFSKNAE